MKAYDASTEPKASERQIAESQPFIKGNHFFVPVFRLAFFTAVGQRVPNEPTQVIVKIPHDIYLGPYEDFMDKE